MSMTQPNPATEAATGPEAIRPFTFEVSDEELADLRRRVKATRWPDRETDPTQGVQLATIQALAQLLGGRGTTGARSRRGSRALPHFVTRIDGVDIHFIHVRSKHEDALPLIVTHGWPGSTIEQLKIIEPLTEPHRPRRRRGGRLPPRDPVAAGPRLLRQADRDRLGPDPHRARVGRADAAARVRQVRGPGRRLGERGHGAAGPVEAGRTARHPHEHARDGPAGRVEGARHRRPQAGGPVGRRGPGVRDPQALLRDRHRAMRGRWAIARRPCTASRTRRSAWRPG